ncbi:MAG: YDG domain-containing protein [Clostridiales Family XIII bacterium]|nr:YDG domain-containing protein [Clostridiales Family XIII bacterium]
MSAGFNLPPDIESVGDGFCSSMFEQCYGDDFTMAEGFNFPPDIENIGNDFCNSMFRECYGDDFTMAEGFNFPQNLTSFGDSFAYFMFLYAGGPVFHISDGFCFPDLGGSSEDGFCAVFYELDVATPPQTRTAGAIINGNSTPDDDMETFAISGGIFPDYYTMPVPAYWGGPLYGITAVGVAVDIVSGAALSNEAALVSAASAYAFNNDSTNTKTKIEDLKVKDSASLDYDQFRTAGIYDVTFYYNNDVKPEITIKVTVDKKALTVSAAPTGSALTYGHFLSASVISGGTVEDADGDPAVGTWAWGPVGGNDASAYIPDVTSAYGTPTGYAATFTPADTDTYSTVRAITTVTVSKKNLTIDLTIADKAYDGLNTAAYSADPELSGIVGSDEVSLTGGTPTFTSTAAGEDIPIDFTTFALAGGKADRYTLMQPSGVKASITNTWSPALGTEYTATARSNGWTNGVFTVTAKAGYTLSLSNASGGGDDGWTSSLSSENAETTGGSIVFYAKETSTGAISLANTEYYKIDMTAPTAKIDYNENGFRAFLNTITFGLFFKDTVDVTIEGDDTASAVANSGVLPGSLVYCKASAAVSDPSSDIDSADWIPVPSSGVTFRTSPNEKFVVYAKLADAAGNVSVIYKDDVVVYTDSGQGTEDSDAAGGFLCGGTGDVSFDVDLNGNTVAGAEIQTGTDPDTWQSLTSGTDYAVTVSGDPADSTDTGIITLQNDWLTTLAAGDYHLRVSYKPMGETYVPATDTNGVSSQDGNEAPQTTAYTLTVSKNAQYIAIADPGTLAFGDTGVTLSVTESDPHGTGAVTWSAPANSVFAIDGDTGALTIIGTGRAAVTAMKAADDCYTAAFDTLELTVEADKKGLAAVIRAANDDTATPGFDLAAETEPPYYEDNYAAGAWEDLLETYAKAAAVFDDESAAQEEAEAAAEALSAALAALGEQDHPVIGYDGAALAEPSKNFEASIGEFGRRIQIEFKGHVGTVAGLRINGADYRIAGRSGSAHPDAAAGFAAYDVFGAEGARVGTITEGSAIVTLDSAFADRLANGAHKLEILFADPQSTGSGTVAIKVYRAGNDGGNDSNNAGNGAATPLPNAGNGTAAPLPPATGDSSGTALWFALAALALAGLVLGIRLNAKS